MNTFALMHREHIVLKWPAILIVPKVFGFIQTLEFIRIWWASNVFKIQAKFTSVSYNNFAVNRMRQSSGSTGNQWTINHGGAYENRNPAIICSTQPKRKQHIGIARWLAFLQLWHRAFPAAGMVAGFCTGYGSPLRWRSTGGCLDCWRCRWGN